MQDIIEVKKDQYINEYYVSINGDLTTANYFDTKKEAIKHAKWLSVQEDLPYSIDLFI